MEAFGFNSFEDPFNNTGHAWGRISIHLAETQNPIPLPDKLKLRRYHIQVNAAYLECKGVDKRGNEITCITNNTVESGWISKDKVNEAVEKRIREKREVRLAESQGQAVPQPSTYAERKHQEVPAKKEYKLKYNPEKDIHELHPVNQTPGYVNTDPRYENDQVEEKHPRSVNAKRVNFRDDYDMQQRPRYLSDMQSIQPHQGRYFFEMPAEFQRPPQKIHLDPGVVYEDPYGRHLSRG